MGIRTQLIAALALAFLAIAIISIWNVRDPRGGGSSGVACTMEAKLCPDGSYVGRTGPNCEFTPCPQAATTTPTGAPIAGAGEHCGGFIRFAPVCATGYHCQLVVSRPDTGGTCVADSVSGGGGILPYNSGIRGTVMLGPTCPVERMPPDPACADRGYETQISVFRAGNNANPIITTTSNAQGIFEVSLPPWDYIVSAAGAQMLPRCSPVSVTVSSNTYASAPIQCDTGIR